MPRIRRSSRGRSAAAQRGPGQCRGESGGVAAAGEEAAAAAGASLLRAEGERVAGEPLSVADRDAVPAGRPGGERSGGVRGGRASHGLGVRGSRGSGEGKRASGRRTECGPRDFSAPRVPLSEAQVGPHQPLLHTETTSVSRVRLFLPPLPSGKTRCDLLNARVATSCCRGYCAAQRGTERQPAWQT